MDRDRDLPASMLRPEISAFLGEMKRLPAVRRGMGEGRLVFALDATMSRQPTWDMATRLQADMFAAAASGLRVQLISFRGQREFDVRPWTGDADTLIEAMKTYRCRGGLTQIERVLAHAVTEHGRFSIKALVMVGDAVEENIDRLCAAAGCLGLLGVPCFVFQEGRATKVETAFREIARLSGGAYGRFDAASADTLRQLLQAVAVFASGGSKALRDLSRTSPAAALLIEQMPGVERP